MRCLKLFDGRFDVGARRFRLHPFVVYGIIRAEPLTFLKIRAQSLGGRLGCDHFRIIRDLVSQLPPRDVQTPFVGLFA